MTPQLKLFPSNNPQNEAGRPQTAADLIRTYLTDRERHHATPHEEHHGVRHERPLWNLWAAHGFTFDYESVRHITFEPVLTRDMFDRPRVLRNLGDFVEMNKNGALRDVQAIDDLRSDPERVYAKLEESTGHATLKEVLVGLFRNNQLRGEPRSLLETMTDKINIVIANRMEGRYSKAPLIAPFIDTMTRNAIDDQVTAEFAAEMKRGFLRLEEMGVISFSLEEIGRRSLTHGRPGGVERTRSEWEEDPAPPVLGIRYQLTEPGYQLLLRVLNE